MKLQNKENNIEVLDITTMPKVTIVTTVWNLYKNNRVEYFRQMMESVHNQTYQNVEHIIIDNNSTDETSKLIQEYVDKGYVANTYFEKTQGLWHGMNRGIKEAKGEFINFMNSDDYFFCDDAIEVSINAILKNGADWSYAYSNKVDPTNTNKILFKWYFEDYATIYNSCCPNHQTLFVRTKLLREQGGFEINENFPSSAFSDDLSMMRLLFSGHIPVVVPKVIVTFRKGGASAATGRLAFNNYVKFIREEIGLYELNESELEKIFLSSYVKKLDDYSFKNILNKIKIPAWKNHLIKLYDKNLPEIQIPKRKTLSNSPKISIIVPVYNAESYIRRGVYSLLNQTFEDIEILCINDGSSDHSLDILNELKKLDCRLKVFNQENKGPATSRNVGLKYASGKYIMFMDADDCYEPDMCYEMYNTIEKNNVDVAMCDTCVVDRNYGNYAFPFNEGKYKIDSNIRIKNNPWIWNKIFKADLINKHKISFPDGHKSDDTVFTSKYMCIASNIYFLHKKLITYFKTENSIVECYNSEFPSKSDIFDFIHSLENIVLFYKEKHNFDNNMEYIKALFCNRTYAAWRNVGREIESEFIQVLRECVKKIGKECLPHDALYTSIIKNNDKIAANLMDHFLEASLHTQRKKYLFQKKIEPIFKSDYVPIIFSSTNDYSKFLSVTIQSIIDNSSSDKNYDIIVLENDISDENKFILKNQMPKNFSIRFYNMNPIIQKYKIDTWFYTGRLASAAYFRLFISEILKGYKKCIYLDVDLILNTNIYELYNIDIDGYYLGAVRDILQPSLGCLDYFKQYLKMKEPEKNYFNSGVLLINIDAIKKDHIFDKFLYFTKINWKYYHDQNVLNASCEGKVKYLSPVWNMITSSLYHLEYHTASYDSPYEYFCENINTILDNNKYNIIHYATWDKPWSNAYMLMAHFWWKYARSCPFYERILHDYFKPEPKV